MSFPQGSYYETNRVVAGTPGRRMGPDAPLLSTMRPAQRPGRDRRRPPPLAMLRSTNWARISEEPDARALHDLGLVNPRRIRVGTPACARPSLAATIEVVRRQVEPGELTVYEGIPSTRRSLVARGSARARGDPVLEQGPAAAAARQARRQREDATVPEPRVCTG